jgi:hypothetical protein
MFILRLGPSELSRVARYRSQINSTLQPICNAPLQQITGLPVDRTLRSWNCGKLSVDAVFDMPTHVRIEADRCLFIFGEVRELDHNKIERLWSENLSESRPQGSYLILKYNVCEGRLEGLSDHWGVQPAYLLRDRDCIYLASLPSPLLKLSERNFQLNSEAIDDFITLGVVQSNKTFISGLELVPANSHFVSDGASWEIRQRSTPQFSSHRTLAEASLGLWERLQAFTDRQFDQGVRHCFLTGGADSRVIAASMSRKVRSVMEFATIDQPAWTCDRWDMRVASQLAQKHEMQHRLIAPTHMQRSVSYPVVQRALKPRRLDCPVIGGMFGTEFVGMGVFQLLPFQTLGYREDMQRLRRAKIFGPSWIADHQSPFLRFQNEVNQSSTICKEWGALAPLFLRSFMTSVHMEEGSYALTLPATNVHANKRLPYMDAEVMDWLAQTPREYLLNFQLYDWIFKNVGKEWATTPFNSTITCSLPDLPSVKSVKDGKYGSYGDFDFENFVLAPENREIIDSLGLFPSENMGPLVYEYGHGFASRVANLIVWFQLEVLRQELDYGRWIRNSAKQAQDYTPTFTTL